MTALSKPKGFSLIEVMVAVSLLALGTVVVHQNFLRMAGLFGLYSRQLKGSLWIHEKMWEGLESSVYADPKAGEATDSSGEHSLAGKPAQWDQAIDSPAERNLFYLKTQLRWQEDAVPGEVVQEAYAFKKDPPTG